MERYHNLTVRNSEGAVTDRRRPFHSDHIAADDPQITQIYAEGGKAAGMVAGRSFLVSPLRKSA